MKVVYRGRALAELAAIQDWIAQDSPGRALYIADRIVKSITGTLSRHPYAGRLTSGRNIRRWPVRGLPYIVIYRVDTEQDRIVVIGVLHAARNGRWL